mgnify:CR=1 FL=1
MDNQFYFLSSIRMLPTYAKSRQRNSTIQWDHVVRETLLSVDKNCKEPNLHKLIKSTTWTPEWKHILRHKYQTEEYKNWVRRTCFFHMDTSQGTSKIGTKLCRIRDIGNWRNEKFLTHYTLQNWWTAHDCIKKSTRHKLSICGIHIWVMQTMCLFLVKPTFLN